MATMREFLSEGRLGDISLGMTPAAVNAALGPAEDRSPRRRPVYLVRYGAMELAFVPAAGADDERLASIAIHFGRPGREIPPALRPTDWLPTDRTTVDEFRRYLNEQGLAVRSGVRGDEESLVLDTGAVATFVDGRLFSIHAKHSEARPGRRQMTVSLPEPVVQELRRRAREEQVSIHELIENLIRSGT